MLVVLGVFVVFCEGFVYNLIIVTTRLCKTRCAVKWQTGNMFFFFIILTSSHGKLIFQKK